MTKTFKKPQRYLNCMVDWDTKSIQKDASGKMTIKGFANTSDKDRVGDVVLSSAFTKSLPGYLENPVVLFQHNWDKVIGKCIKAEVQKDGLYVECEISKAPDVEDVRTKIAEGSLKTFSIGYNEILSDYDESNSCNFIKELELLEISVVTIPCNPKAKFTTEITEKVEEQEETENKSMLEDGFFDYLADALKQLESTSDIDGTFLEEIHSIYKGGPGSGRRGGSGKPKEDKPKNPKKPKKEPAEKPKENSDGSFKIESSNLSPRTTFTDKNGTSYHISKVDGDRVSFSTETQDGEQEDFEMSTTNALRSINAGGIHEISKPGNGTQRSTAGQAAEDEYQRSRRE